MSNANSIGNVASAGRGYEVKAKYRDPKTNETWSGRGRMANWLKRKQDAGEDVDEYLV
jgi:DNA-binding protein H-NS